MQLFKPGNYFVTGTDTGVGKTTVTCHWIKQCQMQGFSAIGCKPIACGRDKLGYNEDVRAYENINSIRLPGTLLNPLCFDLPASPNIAAPMVSQSISVKALAETLKSLFELPIDYKFIEGVGGWKVPLNDNETMIDLVKTLQLPTLLVIGIRVGCLNHALLTVDSIMRDKLPIAGWVANILDPQTPEITKHIHTLQHWITAPYLGQISHAR